MSRCLKAPDPVIDVGDVAQIDRPNRIRRDRPQPLGHPIPLFFHQPPLGVALVSRVREQQRDHVFHGADVDDIGLLCAVAQKLDLILPFLKALVHRLDLRLAQIEIRNIEPTLIRNEPGEAFNCRSHRFHLLLFKLHKWRLIYSFHCH